jgi:hypothetical protein
LTLLQGNGDGTFQARTVFRSTFESFDGLAAADVLGHGRLDIVTIVPDDRQSRHPTLWVLPDNGDGTFGAPIKTDLGPPTTTFPFFSSLLVGDLRGGGHTDVVAIENREPNPEIHALLGNGDGTFQIGPRTTTPEHPSSAVLADFNNDGIPDLALAVPGDGYVIPIQTTVRVLQGNGDGSFRAPVEFAADQGPAALAAADLRGAGTTDLVSANIFANDVSVLLNAGDGVIAPGDASAGAALVGVGGSERSVTAGPASPAGPTATAALAGPDASTLGVTAGDRSFAARSLADDAPALARRHPQAVDAASADLFQPAV